MGLTPCQEAGTQRPGVGRVADINIVEAKTTLGPSHQGVTQGLEEVSLYHWSEEGGEEQNSTLMLLEMLPLPESLFLTETGLN